MPRKLVLLAFGFALVTGQYFLAPEAAAQLFRCRRVNRCCPPVNRYCPPVNPCCPPSCCVCAPRTCTDTCEAEWVNGVGIVFRKYCEDPGSCMCDIRLDQSAGSVTVSCVTATTTPTLLDNQMFLQFGKAGAGEIWSCVLTINSNGGGAEAWDGNFLIQKEGDPDAEWNVAVEMKRRGFNFPDSPLIPETGTPDDYNQHRMAKVENGVKSYKTTQKYTPVMTSDQTQYGRFRITVNHVTN